MRSDRPAFLGIDLGTTNVKAQMVSGDGSIVSSGSCPVGIEYSSDGAAEQDMGEIWLATTTAVKQASAGGAGAAVRAIGISSQGGALQILDSAGQPSGPVIGWQDSRGDPWKAALTQRMGAEWFTTRTSATYGRSSTGQILRLREQGRLPQGFQIGWVGDLVVQHLCGHRAHDGTNLSEAGLYNPRIERADPDLLSLLGLNDGQLPDLRTASTPAGRLLPPVAAELGLPAGIPVGPAVHDQYAAATGCGAVASGDTMLGTGTAWVLLAVSAVLQAAIPNAGEVCGHLVPGLFGHMLSMTNGGACVSWVTRTLNLGAAGVPEVDAMIDAVPPGADGLRFRPLLTENGGHRTPPGTAGRIDGLRLGHGPAHILRGIVEGLACELGRYLLMMQEGGLTVDRLVMCGKAAVSRVTPGIVADTTGLPVDCVAVPETSSLGAAILARSLVEPQAGVARLAEAMRPQLRRVEPGTGSPAARGRLREYLDQLEP